MPRLRPPRQPHDGWPAGTTRTHTHAGCTPAPAKLHTLTPAQTRSPQSAPRDPARLAPPRSGAATAHSPRQPPSTAGTPAGDNPDVESKSASLSGGGPQAQWRWIDAGLNKDLPPAWSKTLGLFAGRTLLTADARASDAASRWRRITAPQRGPRASRGSAMGGGTASGEAAERSAMSIKTCEGRRPHAVCTQEQARDCLKQEQGSEVG